MSSSRTSWNDLPAELRCRVYSYFFHIDNYRVESDSGVTTYEFHKALQLFLVSKQTYIEAKQVFRRQHSFIRIETPWPSASQHLWTEQMMPIVSKETHASNFEDYRLRVRVEVPSMESAGMRATYEPFVIHANDLKLFTQTWFYLDHTYTHLNANLQLKLELIALDVTAGQEKTMGLDMQKELLLPFGNLKGLQLMEFDGPLRPDPSVAKELAFLQARPVPSPEQCLREATRLKAEGNKKLANGRQAEALELFQQSWAALYIVVKDKWRHVHADPFFNTTLTEPPYKDKNGQSERLMIRCELVDSTCLAYLGLKDYDRCIFWGMRTITMLRQSLGIDGLELGAEEEAGAHFPSTHQFGGIYRWTACAYKALGDHKRARALFRVALQFMPTEQEAIRADMAGLLDSPVAK